MVHTGVREGYEVVVVGGGHAGVEAAWAAANLLHQAGGPPRVALVTLDAAKIGVMSCNPAIGGLAKGQIVREIDALGGLMGLAADATGIQFKVLNTSKGPAVRGPRCQSDKHLYAAAVQSLIASRPEIEIIEGAVEGFVVDGEDEDRQIACVVIRVGEQARTIRTGSVVLTTGTFMRGLMHTGETRTPGGRVGEAAASVISDTLRELGFELGRLKTGTPPRLTRESVAWDALPEAKGDDEPTPFSELTPAPGTLGRGWVAGDLACDRFPMLEQVDCRQTRTAAQAHRLILDNLDRAPMFNGQATSSGPRYCPSIEDKCVRFESRDSHGVFLEPESLSTNIIYCNGISTSLPADIQDVLVRTMPGCERAEIVRYGYTVEYDMVRPHQIFATGMTKLVRGLFLAGQINGTSGYEEAAAQGLVAGANAALLAQDSPPWTIGRHEGYIGVLMDDLVTRTPTEPYRMFTSRAEHRLLLRADNAPDRLTPIAERLGLLANTELGRARSKVFAERTAGLDRIAQAVTGVRLDSVALADAARRAEFGFEDLQHALPGVDAPASVWKSALADLRYAPYLERQSREVARQQAAEHRPLPRAFAPDDLAPLRPEARQALTRFQPATFGQAGRLEGITPADLSLLSVLVDRPARAQKRARRRARSRRAPEG